MKCEKICEIFSLRKSRQNVSRSYFYFATKIFKDYAMFSQFCYAIFLTFLTVNSFNSPLSFLFPFLKLFYFFSKMSWSHQFPSSNLSSTAWQRNFIEIGITQNMERINRGANRRRQKPKVKRRVKERTEARRGKREIKQEIVTQ